MAALLSHNSAAKFWLHYGSNGGARSLAAVCGAVRASAAGRSFRTCLEVRSRCGKEGAALPADPPCSDAVAAARSLGFFDDAERLHFLVGHQADRRNLKGASTHSCDAPLPVSAVISFGDALSVCSPELTFVQMANLLSVEELACLGTTLCGIYAKEPFGFGGLSFDGKGGALPRRDQLTTVRSIEAFIEGTPGLNGVKKARSALRLTLERSRSPMETASAMLLSAPFLRGGFGLPKPVLNCRVDLPEWLHAGIGSREASAWGELPYAECDMAFFHRGRSVYVDFHGKWSHEGESNIHHDSLRANAFSQLGMAYYLLTKDQVFSVSLLEKFVQQLRMRLRIYPKTTITDLPKRQHALHRKVIRMVHEGRLV